MPPAERKSFQKTFFLGGNDRSPAKLSPMKRCLGVPEIVRQLRRIRWCLCKRVVRSPHNRRHQQSRTVLERGSQVSEAELKERSATVRTLIVIPPKYGEGDASRVAKKLIFSLERRIATPICLADTERRRRAAAAPTHQTSVFVD